jgi:hypothetical protein
VFLVPLCRGSCGQLGVRQAGAAVSRQTVLRRRPPAQHPFDGMDDIEIAEAINDGAFADDHLTRVDAWQIICKARADGFISRYVDKEAWEKLCKRRDDLLHRGLDGRRVESGTPIAEVE